MFLIFSSSVRNIWILYSSSSDYRFEAQNSYKLPNELHYVENNGYTNTSRQVYIKGKLQGAPQKYILVCSQLSLLLLLNRFWRCVCVFGTPCISFQIHHIQNLPFITSEGEPEYPSSLTLYGSEGLFEERHSHTLGTYRILPNVTQNQRPVWKNVRFNVYLFFGGNLHTV